MSLRLAIISVIGLEAVEAAATFHPEVVLLDIGLPKLNGYEVARNSGTALGAGYATCSANRMGPGEDRHQTKEAGFNSHFVKPVEHSVLMKLLAELC